MLLPEMAVQTARSAVLMCPHALPLYISRSAYSTCISGGTAHVDGALVFYGLCASFRAGHAAPWLVTLYRFAIAAGACEKD